MPPVIPAGPISQIDLGEGRSAPLFIVPFDKGGLCTGPQTRAALIEEAKNGGYSDIFLFSHGWNNDWPTATGRYQDFFDQFRQVRLRAGAAPASYKPLLVGIFWPSTLLVFGKEKGPSIAGGGASQEESGPEEAALFASLYEIGESLAPEQRERFYQLATAEALSRDEARQLAELLLPLYGDAQDEIAEGDGNLGSDLDAEALVDLWSRIPDAAAQAAAAEAEEEDDDDEFLGGIGMETTANEATNEGPQAAGILGKLIGLPRQAIRAFSVWQMKDRAGVVGSNGVSPLLRELIAANANARTHLVGHSFGAKVVLSAVASGAPLADDAVESILLLQPAVNFWCFAQDVDGLGFPGGYHDVPRAVKQPLTMTFSKKDIPLHRLFGVAVTRRKKDLGEVKIAGPLSPSRYGGLGGWGPRGVSSPGTETVAMPRDGEPFPPLDGSGAREILALDGSAGIVNGHGDVATPHTAWALWNQVVEGMKGQS